MFDKLFENQYWSCWQVKEQKWYIPCAIAMMLDVTSVCPGTVTSLVVLLVSGRVGWGSKGRI
jgi:hypothetical protein